MTETPGRELYEHLALHPGATFTLRSRSREGLSYEMIVHPEGRIVHMGEGCEGEFFSGTGGCWHSKESERYIMTTAVSRYEGGLTPAPISFSDEQLMVIKQSIAKGATDQELALFVATCKRTGLDPFLKQIHAIKRWDSKAQKEVMGIQVGIDGLRLIAERTDRYAGMDAVEWLDEDGAWSEVWTGVGDHPLAARTAVYRKDWGDHKAPAVARWDSYVQTYTKDGRTHPTPMWEKMPDVMLGKCAESLALRRAFPAEMSGVATIIDPEYSAEAEAQELSQAGVVDGAVVPFEGVTNEQRATIREMWAAAAKNRALVTEARKRWPHCFTSTANLLAKLSRSEADEVISFFQGALPKVESVATPEPTPGPTPEQASCEHEAAIDDSSTLLTCRKCELVLEVPA